MKNKKIVTIPNLMSLFRLLLLPVIAWLYCVKQDYLWPIILLVISGLSDILDGHIARKYNMVSDLGKILDPVADKLTQGVILLCLVTHFPYLRILFILLIVKEILQALCGLYTVHKTKEVYSSRWHGKLTTVMIYSTIMAHLLFPSLPYGIGMAFMIASMAVMVLSFSLYATANVKKVKNIKTADTAGSMP